MCQPRHRYGAIVVVFALARSCVRVYVYVCVDRFVPICLLFVLSCAEFLDIWVLLGESLPRVPLRWP